MCNTWSCAEKNCALFVQLMKLEYGKNQLFQNNSKINFFSKLFQNNFPKKVQKSCMSVSHSQLGHVGYSSSLFYRFIVCIGVEQIFISLKSPVLQTSLMCISHLNIFEFSKFYKIGNDD